MKDLLEKVKKLFGVRKEIDLAVFNDPAALKTMWIQKYLHLVGERGICNVRRIVK